MKGLPDELVDEQWLHAAGIGVVVVVLAATLALNAGAEKSGRHRLRLAGLVFLPLGVVWTALAVYGGAEVNRRSTPTALD